MGNFNYDSKIDADDWSLFYTRAAAANRGETAAVEFSKPLIKVSWKHLIHEVLPDERQ